MLEYKPPPAALPEEVPKLSLTKVWDVIVRTRRLPDGFDEKLLYSGVRERLRDPEREVRQNALRVLSDLIPVTKHSKVEEHMKTLLPELLSNLGHPAPALRKGALDTLRIYLNHSSNYDRKLKELAQSEDQTVLAVTPYLINTHTAEDTLRYILDQLWKNVEKHGPNQETAVKSLAKMRRTLGEERFKSLVDDERFKILGKINEEFGLPVSSKIESRNWSSEDLVEDKVILETEITLKAGPAITMKIHEESRANSEIGGDTSEDDLLNESGFVRVIPDDSESDYDVAARRTPRKVRFGGEIVKMRTPESDSNNEIELEHETSIHITVTDAVSIKTHKSLIPIRITSLPSTPIHLPSNSKRRLHKSTPNLRPARSKIPLRRSKTTLVATSPASNVKDDANPPPIEPTAIDKEALKSKLTTNQNKRSEEVISPSMPVHNVIEVFHNLTRSPERQKSNSSIINEEDLINSQYNSFQVCEDKEAKASEELAQPEEEKDTFQQETTTIPNQQENWTKSEALDSLNKILQEPNLCETLEPGAAALFIEAFFACHHKDRLHIIADQALSLLIANLRPDVLDQCLKRLVTGLCKIGAPSGVKLALALINRSSAKKTQQEIIENCFGHRLREGALQILMASARLLPSSDIEIFKIAEFAAGSLRDRRRRVRHAALELIATLAQLGSTADILDLVNGVVLNFADYERLMTVVRTRLSRKQLPTVELDGNIRYSSPKDRTEVEWLSGSSPSTSVAPNARYTSASSSSSNSASLTSVKMTNYWRHNSRHESLLKEEERSTSFDENVDGQPPIWAVDPSIFNNKKLYKSNSKGNLRPVYVLQPTDAIRANPSTNELRQFHRRFDRGRSFSPPKPQRKHHESSEGLVGSAPHYSHNNEQKRVFKYNEGFRKSFSSEQLYNNSNNNSNPASKHHEPYSFSLSSRSSTTSTGSSTKSGIWQRDYRSSIPVPILPDNKLRLRTSNQPSSMSGPVIARRDILSPQNSPSVCRISPDHDIQLPPRSSGSESSGYFTPPPETQQAFVKLDNIEEPEPEEEAVQQHRNSVDSLSNGIIHLEASNNKPLQSQFSASSAESFATEEEYEEKPAPASNNSTLELEEVTPSKHATPTSLDELDFIENGPNLDLLVNKSKSVADFKQFLPDINRKNINSAPPLNDNENVVNIFEIPLTPMTPRKIALPGSAECLLDAEIKEVEVNNHKPKILTRRFSRCQSKRSISNKSLTRQDSTNNNSARPATKPKEALAQALGQMESNEWEITVQGLQALTKIIRHHPEIVEAQIHSVCVALAKHIKNLRSQVSRTACLTATELFSTCKRGIDMELEEVAGPLLQRTADTNRFLRADANSTLDIMCDLLPANRVISVITGRGCCHQNAVVRAASARLLADLVTRFGPDKTMQLPKEIRDRILLAGANALTDGNLDARKQAKSMMSVLVGHQHFQRALLDAVPQHVLRHIAKTLNTLKPHSVT